MEIAEGTRKRISSSSGGGSSGGDGDLDRLSALPDCLLHVIMSSLKARQVVQTCVLSTRWRHLWRSVPCLDVDIDEFRSSGGGGGDGGGDSCSDSDSDDDGSNSDCDSDSDDYSYDSDLRYFHGKGEGWEHFEDFAANLMFRCNIALLDSFRLDIDRGRKPRFTPSTGGLAHDSWTYSGWQAEAWLRRAMKYCTPGPTDHQLSLSTSSWRLKRLHLCYIPLYYSFEKHLRSVCRSLEDLELDHCICEIRSISSDSLKNLVLKNCSLGGCLTDIACPTLKTLVINGGSNGWATLNPLVISVPMVAYLSLHLNTERFHADISINKMMPYLDRVSIHLRCHKYTARGKFGRQLYGDKSELLCSMSNATSLELSGVGTMVLGKEPKFIEFHNLRNLLLGNCDLSDDFRLLRFFHQGSPNLEKVTLRHCKFPGYSDDMERTYSDADDKGTHSDSARDENQRKHIYILSSDSDSDSDSDSNSDSNSDSDSEDNEGGTCKLDKTSSSDHRYGLDFLRDANIELEIIHKDGNSAGRIAEELVLDLPPNSKGITDDVCS